MRFFPLASAAMLLLLFACGGKDATAFDPAGKEWEFSMSNPLPVVDNLHVPRKTPLAARLRREIFQPGDVLWTDGDTVLVQNNYRPTFTGAPKKYNLLPPGEVPDTVAGLRLTPGVGTSLNVALYKGDSLAREWTFEEKQDKYEDIAFGELDGRTFRCAFPDGDTMQVHFGTSLRTSDREKDKPFEYFVSEPPEFREERSYLSPGRFSYWGRRINAMRNRDRFFSLSSAGYSSERYVYGRDQNGTVIATYVNVTEDGYKMIDLPLVPVPPLFTSPDPERDFADRINSGVVRADKSYPRIDSAEVSYAYQKDYRGIEYDELSELEFSAEPDGEFIVVVRDRLLQNNKWKLSPDGRYLILLGKNGLPYRHYPILAYTEDYIDLRMPFYVKTREPRGVALESYAEIEVFIRIERRGGATSR